MNTTTAIQPPPCPMRPGRSLGEIRNNWTLPGWGWQVKVNEERAIFRHFDSTLWNRHGQPFDTYKTAHFRAALEGMASFAGGDRDLVDLGLVGLRDKSAFGEARGAVIVYDLPSSLPWRERYRILSDLVPPIDLIAGEQMLPGMIYRLPEEYHAGQLFERTAGVAGLEGVVGRNLESPYIYAETAQMAKAKWSGK